MNKIAPKTTFFNNLIIRRKFAEKFVNRPSIRYSAKSAIETRLARKFQQLSVGRRCACCGRPASCSHHIIRRGASEITRYCWKNAMPLCAECHAKIHDGRLVEPVGRLLREDLEQMAMANFSEYLLKVRGAMTRVEFYHEKEEELDRQLENNGWQTPGGGIGNDYLPF
jgi:hypothetical protein